MDLLAPRGMLAFLSLEEFRMVLLLLPSVRLPTLVHILTAIRIRCNDAVSVPLGAHFGRVGKQRRLAPVVLPVMRIDTCLAFVIVLAVRTPNGLEVIKVKVHVDLKLLDQLYRNLAFVVRERAEFLVLAWVLWTWIEIGRAKLRFVLVRMVELLDSIVGSFTIVAVRTKLRV
jgi:hypothetical protein